MFSGLFLQYLLTHENHLSYKIFKKLTKIASQTFNKNRWFEKYFVLN